MDQQCKKSVGYFLSRLMQSPGVLRMKSKLFSGLNSGPRENQFPVKVDAAGNMVITVAPTAGFEQSAGIVIQGHVDMVCEKSPDSGHNFATDPIRHVFDGDWLKADKTTLGADNGIAIALAMALATNDSVAHPPLELLFTVDEETGLNGAKLLEPGFVSGKVLFNVDSETEGEFTVGCAGGRNTLVSRKLEFDDLAGNSAVFRVYMQGLHGGHSGLDIPKPLS